MRIIGIDPGSTRAGYGIVDFDGNKISFVDGGILKIISKDKGERLVELRESLIPILKKTKPQVAGIEKLYFVKNIKTGMDVSQARGVIMLCLTERKIETKEITPLEVKRDICGWGGADKKSVTKMVKMILKIKDLKQPDDTYDALAIAIVTGYRLKNRF